MSTALLGNDYLAPLNRDITKADRYGLDIVSNLEAILRTAIDYPIGQGEEFEEGEWAVLDNNLKLVSPGAQGSSTAFPVWCGNKTRYDARVINQCTVLTGTGFVYNTQFFDAQQSYAVGDKLTIKNGKVPTLAGETDAIIGQVLAPVTNGILKIQVLR